MLTLGHLDRFGELAQQHQGHPLSSITIELVAEVIRLRGLASKTAETIGRLSGEIAQLRSASKPG